jgi:hypothetical protein
MDHSLAIRNEIMLFSRKWMKLEIIMLRKISQTQKDKVHMLSLICIVYIFKRLESRRGIIWKKEGDE